MGAVPEQSGKIWLWNGFAASAGRCSAKKPWRIGVRLAAERWSSGPLFASRIIQRWLHRRWIIAASCCPAVMRWAGLLRRNEDVRSSSQMNQALVSSPTASANLACRSSKVQKRSAFNSSAQATCSESSVRTPRVGAYCRARSAQVSQARFGKANISHTPATQSLSKLCHALIDSARERRPINA